MTNFTACGDLAPVAEQAYAAFEVAILHRRPCPSIDGLSAHLKIKRDATRVLLARMERANLIKTERPTPKQRVIVLMATGKRTLPTENGGNSAYASVQKLAPWPKRTMTEDGFCAVIAALGRFEDSPEARRDRGHPARMCDLPARADIASYGGVSQVYGGVGR